MTQDSTGVSTLCIISMKFYTDGGTIGFALTVIWIGWLLAVRTFLRAAKATPGALLSVHPSSGCASPDAGGLSYFGVVFPMARHQPRGRPALMIKFRRIWIHHLGARDGREYSAAHRYPSHEHPRAAAAAPPATVSVRRKRRRGYLTRGLTPRWR